MRKRLILTAARVGGVATRLAVRTAPGLAGALLVSYGFWLAWHPLGFIMAGALLLADRWVP